MPVDGSAESRMLLITTVFISIAPLHAMMNYRRQGRGSQTILHLFPLEILPCSIFFALSNGPTFTTAYFFMLPTYFRCPWWVNVKKPNFRPGIVCMLMYLSVKSSHSWFGVNAPPWWSVRCQHLRTGHLQGGHFDPQAVVNKGADGCSHQRERRPRWASPARSQHVLRMHYGLE